MAGDSDTLTGTPISSNGRSAVSAAKADETPVTSPVPSSADTRKPATTSPSPRRLPSGEDLLDINRRRTPTILPGSDRLRFVSELNVLGEPLQECGTDPLTGFYRDGCCVSGPEDLGSHTVCAVVTAHFLEHQRAVGNDLSTPRPEYRFPGLQPGDRWCVVAVRWLQAHDDGAACPVVLASTNVRALQVIPLDVLQKHAVDVPGDPSSLLPGD